MELFGIEATRDGRSFWLIRPFSHYAIRAYRRREDAQKLADELSAILFGAASRLGTTYAVKPLPPGGAILVSKHYPNAHYEPRYFTDPADAERIAARLNAVLGPGRYRVERL